MCFLLAEPLCQVTGVVSVQYCDAAQHSTGTPCQCKRAWCADDEGSEGDEPGLYDGAEDAEDESDAELAAVLDNAATLVGRKRQRTNSATLTGGHRPWLAAPKLAGAQDGLAAIALCDTAAMLSGCM